LRDWKSRWRHKVNPDVSINRDYLNLRHMTVGHRRPAVKTKIQFVDSTRPPLEFNSFEKTKGAARYRSAPLHNFSTARHILLPPDAIFFFKSGRGARPHLQCRVTRPGPAKRFCPNPPEVRQIVMPDGHEIKLGGETGEA
jgi:hypothetical protein